MCDECHTSSPRPLGLESSAPTSTTRFRDERPARAAKCSLCSNSDEGMQPPVPRTSSLFADTCAARPASTPCIDLTLGLDSIFVCQADFRLSTVIHNLLIDQHLVSARRRSQP